MKIIFIRVSQGHLYLIQFFPQFILYFLHPFIVYLMPFNQLNIHPSTQHPSSALSLSLSYSSFSSSSSSSWYCYYTFYIHPIFEIDIVVYTLLIPFYITLIFHNLISH